MVIRPVFQDSSSVGPAFLIVVHAVSDAGVFGKFTEGKLREQRSSLRKQSGMVYWQTQPRRLAARADGQ